MYHLSPVSSPNIVEPLNIVPSNVKLDSPCTVVELTPIIIRLSPEVLYVSFTKSRLVKSDASPRSFPNEPVEVDEPLMLPLANILYNRTS